MVPLLSRIIDAAGRLAAIACLAGMAAPVAHAKGTKVDVELVLDVDTSWSMDPEEQLTQREGYAAAFRSDEVVNAILSGLYGRVAVTYIEFTSYKTQSVVVPWTLIDSAAGSRAFADALTGIRPMRMRSTSISGAIDDARRRLDDNGFDGERRVIDISGDGPNNNGRIVTHARDDAVADGITINGLPLMTGGTEPIPGHPGVSLDQYYSRFVVGGSRAFVLPVHSWDVFPDAVRRKLVLELAGGNVAGVGDEIVGPSATPRPLVRLTSYRPR